MTESAPSPTPTYDNGRFLLRVAVETAPVRTLVAGIGELKALLDPIATSNMTMLNAFTPLIQQTDNQTVFQAGIEPARIGLLFANLENTLLTRLQIMNPAQEESVHEVARLVQVWAWTALRLRDEMKRFAMIVTAASFPDDNAARLSN